MKKSSMNRRRRTQTPESQRHSRMIIEKGNREALLEAAEALGSYIDEAICRSNEHREKLKPGRRRTLRALQQGATQIIESLAAIKTTWALNGDDFKKAVEQWHEAGGSLPLISS